MGMQVVEVAIGLVLMWLLLALACTAIVEWVNERLELRSQALAAGIAHLLREVSAAETPEDKNKGQTRVGLDFGSLPPIKACDDMVKFLLQRKGTTLKGDWRARSLLPAFGRIWRPPSDVPSYVATTQLAAGIIGQLSQGATSAKLAYERADVVIEALHESPFKTLLRGYLASANGDLAAFEKKLAAWFDGTLERIGGEFKRIAQRWSFVIALAICAILNADSISVAATLWQNQPLRQTIADQAARVTLPAEAVAADECRRILYRGIARTAGGEGNSMPATSPAPAAGPDAASAPTAGDDKADATQVAAGKRLDCLSQSMEQLPIGWGDALSMPNGRPPHRRSTGSWPSLRRSGGSSCRLSRSVSARRSGSRCSTR